MGKSWKEIQVQLSVKVTDGKDNWFRTKNLVKIRIFIFPIFFSFFRRLKKIKYCLFRKRWNFRDTLKLIRLCTLFTKWSQQQFSKNKPNPEFSKKLKLKRVGWDFSRLYLNCGLLSASYSQSTTFQALS